MIDFGGIKWYHQTIKKSRGDGMLAEKRLSEIVAIVEEKRSVTVTELMDILSASESTVRRDLNVLDGNGQIKKVHGGAVAVGNTYYTVDADVVSRKDQNNDEKVRIGKYAASLIKPGDFVFIDAGTTTEVMLDYITEKKATFVTNGIDHARKLSQMGLTTYILGGEFKATTEAIVGEEAIESLNKYNFTIGFFGTNGIAVNNGYSTPDVKEAMVKKKAIRHCRNRYILSDSSKFTKISSVIFAEFESARVITTAVHDEAYRNCRNIVEVDKL